MTIKETNDPVTLKNYVRYVVGKYHELASKYSDLQNINIMQSSDLYLIKLEKKELEKERKLLFQEIKNLYREMGSEKFVDELSKDMLELKNKGLLNNAQIDLFNEFDEAPPIIEFNEVDLNDNGCVDIDNTNKIQ